MDKPISNFKQIMDLVEQYPNDQQLGSKVRQLYWEQRKNVTDPNQIDLFEDEDTRDDAILGYD
tara:strand:- start:378 stop:566 length:189 start_codon:yes stop_codon:yes gene_type:complete